MKDEEKREYEENMSSQSEAIYKIVMRSPCDCSSDELATFEKVIKQGGEVSLCGLTGRIKNAKYLAWYEAGSDMIGVAALKNPNEDHRNRLFKNAKSKEQPSKWKTELGWIFVDENHRRKGVGRQLICHILTEGIYEWVYATVREDNKGIIKLLRGLGFEASGVPYVSSRDHCKLVLYVKTDETAGTTDQQSDN